MEKAGEKAPRVLSIQQTAQALAVCPETIRRALVSGTLRGFRIKRCWRIAVQEIERLCGNQTMVTAAGGVVERVDAADRK